jgi:hypothetical protein
MLSVTAAPDNSFKIASIRSASRDFQIPAGCLGGHQQYHRIGPAFVGSSYGFEGLFDVKSMVRSACIMGIFALLPSAG